MNLKLSASNKINCGKTKSSHWMMLISFSRFIYGLVLLAAGIAIFNLIGKNLSSEVSSLVDHWNIGRHFYFVHWLMQKASIISEKLLWILAVGNFAYAALAFVEATGLAFGQRWAYWLVILDTASFIQLCKGFNWINFGLLMFYIFSVIYLLFQLIKRPELSGRTA
jgi:uncharacterized membrane protein (DUF2068 family)